MLCSILWNLMRRGNISIGILRIIHHYFRFVFDNELMKDIVMSSRKKITKLQIEHTSKNKIK